MSATPSSRTVILGVSGSIAAYKAAEIASRLRKSGHEVFAVMTRAAADFITPLTLATLTRNPVLRDLSEEQDGGWKPGHIDLADRADLLLIAPASANTIARLAHGFADDALGALALATRAPLLIAPAMNGKMWNIPRRKPTRRRSSRGEPRSSAPRRACWPAGMRGKDGWPRSPRSSPERKKFSRRVDGKNSAPGERKKEKEFFRKSVDGSCACTYSQTAVSYSHAFHTRSHS